MDTLYSTYIKFGIIRKGHFLLSSGRHSDIYIDKDMVYRSPLFTETIRQLAEACYQFSATPTKGLVITGPAVAGAVLAAPVWYKLNNISWKPDITFVYPEKMDGGMTFRRGYDKHLDGKEVILVEDIITTGRSVEQTAEAVKFNGGKVTGCVCIWNRTFWKHPDFPIHSLINVPIDSWTEEDCPACQKGIPLTDPKGDIIS